MAILQNWEKAFCEPSKFIFFLTYVFLIVGCSIFPRFIDVLESVSTTLTSPNYPMDYGDDLKCSWELTAEIGFVVKVTFNDFHLQPDNPASNTRCPFDRLEFHDGHTLRATFIASYCDTLHPEVMYSTGRDMYVEFKSDQSLTYKGFNISVSAVKAGMVLYNTLH